ncbi:MAG: hypothetical protein NHB15_11115 [Methanosarcina barkeri]|nr:hypothetical protein [Methanosarcina sp. ERenArc_MAG2]
MITAAFRYPARWIGFYSRMIACARTWYDTTSLKNSRIDIQTCGGIETPYIQIVCMPVSTHRI